MHFKPVKLFEHINNNKIKGIVDGKRSISILVDVGLVLLPIFS